MSTSILCPFCGAQGVGITVRQDSTRVATCGDCGATGPLARTHSEALEFWGKRSKAAAELVAGDGTRIPAKVKVEATLTKRPRD